MSNFCKTYEFLYLLEHQEVNSYGYYDDTKNYVKLMNSRVYWHTRI